MTNALWEDLRGMDKVKAVLATANTNAQRRRSRSDPNRRRDGESEEHHAHRLAVQAQRQFLNNQRDNPFLLDVDEAA